MRLYGRAVAGACAAAALSACVPAASSAAGLLSASAQRSFDALSHSLGGTNGVTVSGIGRTSPMSQAGSLRGGVAWSTIKVPIALAVEVRAKGHPSAATNALLRRAISASDNDAATALWSGLGPPATAARLVERQLAAAGDTATRVQTRVVRSGFTSFGQTSWPLAVQQQFIAALPCLPHSGPVLSLMGKVESDQRWGFGSAGVPARFKGGWGPTTSGRYFVRQMGVLQVSRTRAIAATIATLPSDGSFATGTRNLTRIAQWLVAHVSANTVPARTC